jgi:hypothetical protein
MTDTLVDGKFITEGAFYPKNGIVAGWGGR